MRAAWVLALVVGLLCWAPGAMAAPLFSTGSPDGRMAMASRPGPVSGADQETEAADDFVLTTATNIGSATFVGLLPSGAPLASIERVRVEIYRVFPVDSDTMRTITVPSRTNSPSDVQFDARDSLTGTLSSSASVLSPSFTAANSVDSGIHPAPSQTTGGEGAASGEEVAFNVSFTTPLSLPAGHYFFVPQVLLSSGHFFWLSAPRPIVAPGTPFTPDLQAWIRNAQLDPDWLRVGTDIVGGATPPTFNGTFSLSGTAASSLTVSLAGTGSGTITSSPPGISCPGNCSHSYASGTPVALTATPATGSTFAGWGGDCSGTGACQLTMTGPHSVTARFDTSGPGGRSNPSCTLTPSGARVFAVTLVEAAKKNKPKKKRPKGVLKLTASCNQAASVTLTGTVTAVLKAKGHKPGKKGKRAKPKLFQLAHVSASITTGKALTLTVKLPKAALAALKAGARESVAFRLTATNANGAGHTSAKINKLKLVKAKSKKR